jgi:GrpB-like predicted nucleotidyltransferase (UPF0157 family)
VVAVRLRPAEEFRERASAIAAAERERLRTMGVPGQLELTGGSSVPGALTRGDVDLHLRVRPADFAATVARLRRAYEVVHPEIWAPTLATFAVPAALPAGLAVTPAGSEHDLRFTRSWRLLAADPALVDEYNAVKLAAGEDDYEDRKSAFFDRLLELWPAHPAGGPATDR